jgi:hydrogenase-4 component E
MPVTVYEIIGIMAAVLAVWMLGSRNVSFHVSMLTWQIALISIETAIFAYQYQEPIFYLVALVLFGQRAIYVPWMLRRIMHETDVANDPGTLLPAPLTMHLSILLFVLGFFVANHLPIPNPAQGGQPVLATATASISLLFTGIVMMLTRRLALSQIVGFITIENGVYLFALTQTDGLPFLIEVFVLFDILGAIMIAGVLIFRIKRSFEHIDVTRLTNLKH